MIGSPANAKWTETRPDEDFFRVLAPDGSLVRALPEYSEQELLRWHRALRMTRLLETATMSLQRRGEIPVAGLSLGEEAVGLGAMAALRPGDWCFPSYRQLSGLLYWQLPIDRAVAAMRGMPPEQIAAHLSSEPPAIHLMPYTIFLGASVPHAVGCALSDRLNRREVVTIAFTGEGATSEGDFYEGMNFAGVFQVPLVLVVQNNQWSISVPAHRQSAARHFADKAVAAGIRNERVDGNDVFAVHHAVGEAVARARNGEGPTLVEAVTYRMHDHNSADSAAVYRSGEEADYWRSRDPLDRFERFLRARGVLDDRRAAQIDHDGEQDVRAAIVRARAVPAPPAVQLFANHLGGEPSWALEQQRSELLDALDARNPWSEEC